MYIYNNVHRAKSCDKIKYTLDVSRFLQSHLQFWFEYNNVLRAKSTDKIVYLDFVNCFSNFDFGRHG